MSKFKLKVYLKSGNVVEFKCSNWKFDIDSNGNYKGYIFENLVGKQVCLDVKEIEGYESKIVLF